MPVCPPLCQCWHQCLRLPIPEQDSSITIMNFVLQVPVQMMKVQHNFHAFHDNQTAVLRLPFDSNNSMVLVLPPRGGLAELEQHICPMHYARWLEGLKRFGMTFEKAFNTVYLYHVLPFKTWTLPVSCHCSNHPFMLSLQKNSRYMIYDRPIWYDMIHENNRENAC